MSSFFIFKFGILLKKARGGYSPLYKKEGKNHKTVFKNI